MTAKTYDAKQIKRNLLQLCCSNEFFIPHEIPNTFFIHTSNNWNNVTARALIWESFFRDEAKSSQGGTQ